MEDALSKLKWCSSLGDVLWFGFGIEHPVRHLAKTANGVSCIALCAFLGQLSWSNDAGAAILAKLAEIHGVPLRLRPSLQQWDALIKICLGTLATTPFGCVAELFTIHNVEGNQIE